jgi:predicted Rossmann fold nucleotide-binding protein DprA/Smf involved in DNA uptake
LFARDTGQGFAREPPHWKAPADPDIDIARVQAELASLLSPSPTDLDGLIRQSAFPAAAVMAALMQLELGLIVEFLPGNRVCRIG